MYFNAVQCFVNILMTFPRVVLEYIPRAPNGISDDNPPDGTILDEPKQLKKKLIPPIGNKKANRL